MSDRLRGTMKTSGQPDRLAALDLGTNSILVLVVRREADQPTGDAEPQLGMNSTPCGGLPEYPWTCRS